MSITSIYISDEQFQAVLATLNLVKTEDEQQELLDRVTGDLEADLCERFLVPLLEKTGAAYEYAPQFARNKVLNALKSKLRQLIASDNMRNLVIDSTQKYVDVNKMMYKDDINTLLDAKKSFGFKLNVQAEGSIDPVQSMGLARASNELDVTPDFGYPNL